MADNYEFPRPQTRQTRTGLTVSTGTLFLFCWQGIVENGKIKIPSGTFEIPASAFLLVLIFTTVYFLISFLISYHYDKSNIELQEPLQPLRSAVSEAEKMLGRHSDAVAKSEVAAKDQKEKSDNIYKDYERSVTEEMNREGAEAVERAALNNCLATMKTLHGQIRPRDIQKILVEYLQADVTLVDQHLQQAKAQVEAYGSRFRGISTLKNTWLEHHAPVSAAILVLAFSAFETFLAPHI